MDHEREMRCQMKAERKSERGNCELFCCNVVCSMTHKHVSSVVMIVSALLHCHFMLVLHSFCVVIRCVAFSAQYQCLNSHLGTLGASYVRCHLSQNWWFIKPKNRYVRCSLLIKTKCYAYYKILRKKNHGKKTK